MARRTSDIEYDAHVLQQDGEEAAAPRGIGMALIEGHQSLHKKSDAPRLARRLSARALRALEAGHAAFPRAYSRRMGLSAKPPDKASGSFSMSIPKPVPRWMASATAATPTKLINWLQAFVA